MTIDRWLVAVDPDDVRPGVVGLVVVLALVVATVFLMRSFLTQLRRIDFDEDAEDAGPDGPDPHRPEAEQPPSGPDRPEDGRRPD